MDNQHKKISGYRDLSQDEIDIMNWFKLVEKLLLKELSDAVEFNEADPRWAAIAKTDLQKAFMVAVRAVAKPGEDND